MTKIITSDNIVDYTGWTLSAQEKKEIERICQSVSNLFQNATNRKYSDKATDAVVDEISIAEPRNVIYLQNTPATEITSIEVLDIGSNPESWDEVTDKYHLVSGYKILLSSKITGHTKITYKGSVAPDDVKQALIEWALLVWGARFDDGKISKKETVGVNNKEYLIIDNLPMNIQSVIDMYRKYNV